MEETKKRGRPKGSGKVPRDPGNIPANREQYLDLLRLELSTASSDLARLGLVKEIGVVTGTSQPDLSIPQLRASGRLPSERVELLWLRSRILAQVETGRMGSTLVESLRSIRDRLEDLDRKTPPTPEQVKAELAEDLPGWPEEHLVMAVEEAIKRGILT